MLSLKGKLFAALILFMVLVIAISPYVLKWQVSEQLTMLTGQEAVIADLSFDLFNMEVEVRGLLVGPVQLGNLIVDVELMPLLKQQLHLTQVHLTGGQLVLAIEEGGVSIPGISLPASDENASPSAWQVHVDEIKVSNFDLEITNKDIEHLVRVDNVLINTSPPFSRHFQIKALLGLGDGRLEYTGEVDLGDSENSPLRVTGRLMLEDLMLARASAELPFAIAGSVKSLSTEVELEIGEEIIWKLNPELMLSDLETPWVSIDGLKWRGDVNGGMRQDAAPHLQINGDLSLTTIQTLMDGPALTLSELSWMGPLTLDENGDLSTSGEVQLDGVAVSQISQVPDVAVSGLVWQGNVSVSTKVDSLPRLKGRISVTDIVIDKTLTAAELVIQEFVFDGMTDLAAESIIADTVAITLTRNEAGRFTFQPEKNDTSLGESLPEEFNKMEESAVAGESDSALDSPVIRIGTVKLSGSNTLTFEDQSVDPPVKLTFDRLIAEINNIQNKDPFPFSLSAHHQESDSTDAGFQLSGTTAPFQQAPSSRFLIQVVDFELHQLGPYLGDGIQRGRLSLTAEGDADTAKIKVLNKITIDGLLVDEDDIQQTTGEMPIALALSLLKDGDGQIKIEVPIDTTFGNFSVGTGDIVRRAVMTATRKAALTYAKFALQPFGALMLIKEQMDSAGRPSFQPIIFMPGSSNISEEADAYVEKLSELLNGRPGIMLTICGVATLQDPAEKIVATETGEQIEVVDKRALALSRGAAVRSAIKARGIAEKRLFACRPEIKEDDSSPRVVLTL